jgi:hypothetical protein
MAFSAETPIEIAYGTAQPIAGARLAGDTVNYHDTTSALPSKTRKVELIVNGQPVASREVSADGLLHDLSFTANVARSSWIAVRQFPQVHTNPVNVIVGGKPIRASRRSAQWCAECIDVLWRSREKNIAPAERDEAKRAFGEAKETYRRIATEAPDGS